MKLVVKREPFTQALTAAAAVVPVRSVRPILKNALLVANEDGTIEIRATDMEVGLIYRVQAESVLEPASLSLPCSTLSGLLKECTEEVVTLDTEGPNGTLKAGRDQFDILGMESSDFPEVPDLDEDGSIIAIPAADFRKMIDRTLFAAAREQGRYAINGIFINYKDKLLEVVATDGRRMAFTQKKLKSAENFDEGVIVPIKMMQEVRKLCDSMNDGENIEFAVRGRQVIIRGGEQTLSSVLLEGIFPKYKQVIPQDMDKEITFARDNMLHGLRKAAFLTSDETRTVTLQFSPGTCLIEANSPDKGKASVTLEVEYDGDELKVSFNPQYIQECLKVLNEDQIKLDLKDGSRPAVIREKGTFLYVIMPVNPKK